ncbi:MAG TPA: hypothetical protein PK777_00915, partial [Thermoguttaceae bacterium]|nr:hypothetical protein [Thermoguttaceae bacterium]
MCVQHSCSGCVNRRECLSLMSLSALGLGAWSTSAAAPSEGPGPADFVDPTKLRPKPEVRIMASFLEMPRPYWLG